MTKKLIKIDSEFQNQIPALHPQEEQLLEEKIKLEGCRDPVVLWKGKNILLDGHHRYAICQKHGIEFKTVSIVLADREAAADWIDANQLARRNLNPDQFTLLLGRRYERMKKQGSRTDLTSDQIGTKLPPSTAKALAKQHGVGEQTVKRAGKFAKAVETMKAVDPDIEKKVSLGKAPPKGAVVRAAELLKQDPQQAKAVLNGDVTVAQLDRQNQRTKTGGSKSTNDVDPPQVGNALDAKAIAEPVEDVELAVMRATRAAEKVLSFGAELASVRPDILKPFKTQLGSLCSLWARLFLKKAIVGAATAESGEQNVVIQ